jgi:Rrf2 family protein
MLLTKASEYAMLSLMLISRQDKPEDVDTLSKRLNISRSFLAKVLQGLAREGILKSYKGAKGGFALNQKPEDISIKRVIEIAEKKPITIFECAQDTAHCPSNKGEFCMIWPFLNNFQSKIDEFLAEMTLKDIL